MAGVFRKSMVYLGLMEPGEEEYDAEGAFLDEEPEPAGVRPLATTESRVRRYPDPAPQRGTLALDPEPRFRREEEPVFTPEPAAPAYRITTLCPTKYNDAREIGEQFRLGVPVIMNVTDMEEKDAKRLVDFAAGLTFGLHGRLDKVTNKVFLLSPSNIEVSDAEMARIREGGFFNQS